jgi:hypothetical protein
MEVGKVGVLGRQQEGCSWMGKVGVIVRSNSRYIYNAKGSKNNHCIFRKPYETLTLPSQPYYK